MGDIRNIKDIREGALLTEECGCKYIKVPRGSHGYPTVRMVKMGDLSYSNVNNRTWEMAHERPLGYAGWTFDDFEVLADDDMNEWRLEGANWKTYAVDDYQDFILPEFIKEARFYDGELKDYEDDASWVKGIRKVLSSWFSSAVSSNVLTVHINDVDVSGVMVVHNIHWLTGDIVFHHINKGEILKINVFDDDITFKVTVLAEEHIQWD